jgi:hypothetical protein
MAPDADETKRRSRGPWPLRTQATTTPAGTHDHGLPGWLKPAFIGCGVAILALVVAVIYLMIYIIGRGQVREQQIQDTRDQVREQLCDVLDGLPQGGVLDLTRGRLGCGPGLPLSQFSPDIQQRLSPTPPQPSAPVVQQPAPSPSAAPEPPPAAPATPEPPPAADSPAPLPGGADGPMSPSEPPPLSPPSQVRELVCDLLPICPEEPTP